MDSLLKPPAHLLTLDQLRSRGRQPADPHRPDALLRLFNRTTAIPDPTAAPPANSYRRWTTEEDALLTQRAADGATITELATEFGRHKGAIRFRLARHRFNGDNEPW